MYLNCNQNRTSHPTFDQRVRISVVIITLSSNLAFLFATVGLGVSAFGYRISHDSFRCCFGAWIRLQWPCGHCEGEGGDGVLSGVHIYCFLALQLLSSLSESPSLHLQSFFAHPPLPVYIYLLQVYIE